MKIEHPKLKKIGGLRNFAQSTVIKILAVILIASLAGYLGGYSVQKSFRNLTGYNQIETQAIEEPEILEAENPPYEGDNPYVGTMIKVIQTINSGVVKAHNVFSESDLLQAANSASAAIIFAALNPLFKVMDWTAFWLTATLTFAAAAWLTSKLLTMKQRVITSGVNPTVIKNMKILEDKVKELVNNANKTGSK